MSRTTIALYIFIAGAATYSYADEPQAGGRRLLQIAAPQFTALGSDGKWNGIIGVSAQPCPPGGSALNTAFGFYNVTTPKEALDQVAPELDQAEKEAEILQSQCKK